MTKRNLSGLFVRMHLSFVEDGLLAAINERAGIGSTIALMILAKHMDEQGISFPSQALIAQEAGVSERTAGTWVRNLLAFLWNGKPIVTRVKKPNGKGHLYNVYTVLPASQWAIFEGDVYEKEAETLDAIG